MDRNGTNELEKLADGIEIRLDGIEVKIHSIAVKLRERDAGAIARLVRRLAVSNGG